MITRILNEQKEAQFWGHKFDSVFEKYFYALAIFTYFFLYRTFTSHDNRMINCPLVDLLKDIISCLLSFCQDADMTGRWVILINRNIFLKLKTL